MSPQAKPRMVDLQREVPDPNADALVAQAIKDARKIKAAKQQAAKKRVTPAHKRMHAVDNEMVHSRNESARQVDESSEIDRDSELPVTWRRPGALDAPPPRAGYVHRWKRYRLGNTDDGENLADAIAEGWSPVKAAQVSRAHELTADLNGKYGQYIVKKGLILCEMPLKLFLQKKKFYKQHKARMTEAIDRNLFKINDRRMPLLQPERSTRVSLSARRGRLDDNVPGDEA